MSVRRPVPPPIEAVEGDITTQQVDAIVNAANSSLLGGGGVDGAIHRAAGPALLAECQELRRTRYLDGLPAGHAIATGAGDLPSRWVVHAVGPNRRAGQTNPTTMASCFESSLREVVRVGGRSVAFPAVGAGVYGWDVREVAEIAVRTVRSSALLTHLDLVRFVLRGEKALRAFERALATPPDPASPRAPGRGH
ncbi:O-acetyl-ADP-ribose deacetylase [Luteipulveratus mongoliensis]|uniref:Macro domain-containing protein n=1 Tax=Luteipulveratus mongoliensis TaxID=571913 RepID=A0A0K1JFK4_9MICO|nr:O-acetyl-ADP-ribose deacetylase [Luteipulveratus mongoliensis]AKU15489.1 hypothetical protein VV02_05765 [Luteipulveratus mongoliensis]